MRIVFVLALPFLLCAEPFSPKQTLAQTPRDTPIRVLTQDSRSLCYAPTFSGGTSYITLAQAVKAQCKRAMMYLAA